MDFYKLFINVYCIFVTLCLTNCEECVKVDNCRCRTSKGTVDLNRMPKSSSIINIKCNRSTPGLLTSVTEGPIPAFETKYMDILTFTRLSAISSGSNFGYNIILGFI
ncbi:uncharacterized protein LOC123532634 [Mercenaria mercenaria]|uniref:uncharacterized protein LOC123532634 n=1 Tax=Mercenaria mercenaria TaxID=6596 RepID=UPI00234F669E|nr:uncharacterized protein LOC123532634 [Mercenaria mercenaria]